MPMSIARRLPALLVASIGTMLSAQSPLQRAPGAHVVSVTTTPGPWSEPGIALDPRDPSRIFAVFQGPAAGAYSTDSGRTFRTAGLIAPTDWAHAGDVSTT